MGAFNDKMTSLADAFRSKFSLTGALSIDDMTVTVRNAVIGEGGGEGGVDPSVIETTAADVLASAWFMDNTGTLQQGSIQTVTAQLNGNVFSVAKGYIAEAVEMTVAEAGDVTVTDNVVNIPPGYISTPRTATVPLAQEPSVSGNVVTLYKGYLAEQKTITVEGGTDIPDGYADVSGVTATPNDVLMTARFVDSNGELQEGTIQPVTAYLTDNVFEVEEGFISNTTLTVTEAAAPTVSDNVVTVNKGYQAAQQKVTVGTALAAKTYTPGSNPIVIKAGQFLTGDQTIEAVQTGGGADLTIYRCTEYDSGEAIPAYSNVTVSGITSDSAANGTMTLLDRTASGGNRLWGKDSYRLGYDSFNEHWCFYNSSNVYMPWADNAMFKAKCIYTTNEGTNANKINWHDVTVDGDSCRTELLDTSTRQPETSDYNYFFWFMLKLKAGVTYTIGMVKDVGTIQNHHVYLYNEAGTEKDMYSPDVEVNGVTLERGDTYTPSADEFVSIKAGNAGRSQYNGTFQLYCYPAPEVIDYVNKEPWQCTWQAVTGTGNITLATQAVAERPATGAKVWSGYIGTQDASTKEWSFSNAIKNNMSVQGIIPRVGNVYTEDTSLQIAGTYAIPPADGKMVALFHMDKSAYVIVDATETCMLVGTNQCNPGNTDQIKFGAGSFGYNYMDVNDYMDGKIIDLPELDAFTVEFWHYYAGYYDKFGGPLLIVQNPDGQYGDYSVTWLSGANFPQGSEFRIEKRWFHHALVREAGSQTVTEYIDGKPAAMYQFAPKLGGGRKVWVRAGGFEPGQSGDVRNYVDELAIFNYARYHGEFTPPTEPYADVISGLGRQKGEPRQVEVSGITGIVFANDPGYCLVNPQATGTYRQWVTADGAWYTYFDWDSNYCWVVANKTSAWDDGYVCAARLAADSDTDQSLTDFNPIGHPDWIDNYTNAKVTVRQLREPAEDDLAYDRITLSNAGMSGANGTYHKDWLEYTVGGTSVGVFAYTNSNGYCVTFAATASGSNIDFDHNTMVVTLTDQPYNNTLYSCPTSEMFTSNKQWTVVNGSSPAPKTTFN